MRTLVSLALLAACGGGSTNIKPTLKLADRTDAEIARLISAAGGTDMFGSQAQLDQFSDSFRTDPCPAITVAGNAVTVTGGCTTTDGVQIAGSATAENDVAWDQITYNPGSDSVYTFVGFALTQQSFTQTFDGSFRQTDNFTTWDGDITVTQLDLTVRSDIHYECDAGSGNCDLSGSGLELPGVGGVTADGTVSVANQTASASFTLHGIDTLTAQITQGCVAWQIDGSDRAKVCQ
jgi:hypothetical protein